MADTTTITMLPDATIPLSGSEFLALDQGPNTVRARVRDLPGGAPLFQGALSDFVTMTAPNVGFAAATFSTMTYDHGGFFDPLRPNLLNAITDGFYRAGMELTWDVTGADTAGFIQAFVSHDSITALGSYLVPLSANENAINLPLVTPPFPLAGGQGVTFNVAAGANALSVEVIGWIELIGGASITPPANRVLYDAFTDLDGTSLSVHTMNTGPGWTIIAGGWTIQADRAQDTAVVGGQNVVVSDCGHGDSTISAICDPTTNYDFGLVFNVADSANYWLVTPEFSTNLLRLFSQIGGSFSLVDSAALTLVSGTPITLKVVAAGDTVHVYVDGTMMIAYTIGGRALQGHTLCGLRVGSGEPSFGTTFDDFQVFA